jgi:hypothetical protein
MSDPHDIVKRKLQTSRIIARQEGYAPCSVTVDELVAIYSEQDGRCKVCKAECGSTICLDHCHETGRFRGFICRECNAAISCAFYSPSRLRQLADYLDS